MKNEKYFSVNKSLWDQKTKIHLTSEFYDMPSFFAGKNGIDPETMMALGDVKGKSILHLQCHFGQDTLALARLGARTTGVDFSSESIKTARDINLQMGLNAEFIEANVLDVRLDQQFDIVFASFGVTVWLPDLEKWADTIDYHLKPGGTFLYADFHPMFNTIEFEDDKVAYPYSSHGLALKEEITGTYADFNAAIKHDEYFWTHGISDIMTPILERGLILKVYSEFYYSPYNCFPNLTKIDDSKYQYKGFGVEVPHFFIMKFQK